MRGNTRRLVNNGRRAAERLMHAKFRISRPGEPVIDPVTLKQRTDFAEIYCGKGKIQSRYQYFERSVEVAGATVSMMRLQCHIPIGATDIQPGDRVEVLANPDDELLAGKVFMVAGSSPSKSIATALRFYVIEQII